MRHLDKLLFDNVTSQLKAKAVTVKTGTLVDVTIIASVSHDDEEAAGLAIGAVRLCMASRRMLVRMPGQRLWKKSL